MKRFDITQNGRSYILTTEVQGEYVRITCVETGISNPPIYFGEFSLTYLQQLSKVFRSISTIYQAQEILNQTVEIQKVTIENKGNIINIILYLTRETESENSVVMEASGMDNQAQSAAYSQPLIYNSVETTTNTTYTTKNQGYTDTNINYTIPMETTSNQEEYTTTTETANTVYNIQDQGLIDTNITYTTPIETTTNQEIYTTTTDTTNTNYENYQNYDNNQNYENYENYTQLDTQVETTTYNTSSTSEVLTLPLTTQTQGQNNNQYYNEYQYQTKTETTQAPIEYIPPKREHIQYTIPNPQKIVETTKTTTTTTQQYNPVPQTPSVDMTIYNEKITKLQTETNRIRGEYETLKNEANRLTGEVGQLKSQITVLLEENRVLRQKNGSMPSESQIHEITILKQENERLIKQLEQYINLENTFEQYKHIKEQEINYLKLQIEEYIKNQKKLEEIIFLKTKEIEELKYQIQQLIKNVNISESQNYIMRQQQKGGAGSQTLTIQDTHMEIIKGDILKSTAELELLTRKICQDHQKVTLDLLYKATIDSDKASVFHNKCDSSNRTLVLVKSGNGKRFGGYTTCSWKGNSIEKKDDKAFVFSLDKMQIYDIIPGEDAIGCYPKYGPVFLGCQIRIYDEFFTKGGTTFEKGLNYNTQEDYELTGGMKKFDVKEIEVYSIQLD